MWVQRECGAGEGNRTLVVSLGRLGGIMLTREKNEPGRSVGTKKLENKKRMSDAFTAGLPQPVRIRRWRAASCELIDGVQQVDNPDIRIDLIGLVPAGIGVLDTALVQSRAPLPGLRDPILNRIKQRC